MLQSPFDLWWCCLNPRERNTIQFLLVAYLSNSEYITETNYIVIATVTGLGSFIKMNEFFIAHYGLTAGVILDEEGLPVSVFFFDTVLWPAFAAFALTDGFICAEPCEQLTYSQ